MANYKSLLYTRIEMTLSKKFREGREAKANGS